MLTTNNNSNDPWWAIHQMLEGKMPFADVPGPANQPEWIRGMIQDIVGRTLDSVSAGADQAVRGSAKDYRKEAEGPSVSQQERRTAPRTAPYTPGTSGYGPSIGMSEHAVIVRYKLPASVQTDRLRLYASVQQVRLEGLPGYMKRIIALPVPVVTQGATARLIKDTLVIRLRKTATFAKERELFIRFE
jgi:hypothetical protein